MATRRFQQRIEARYRGGDNELSRLALFHLREGVWQPMTLNELSPGFSIFAYSILTCQHTHLRINAAERGLHMVSASGEIDLTAAADWTIRNVRLAFDVELSSGSVDEDTTPAIIERMKMCPVSKNLSPDLEFDTRVRFESL